MGQFDPKSAIFVCNKWDKVPHDEKDKVKKYVMSELKESWEKFTEEQVFFMSAQEVK